MPFCKNVGFTDACVSYSNEAYIVIMVLGLWPQIHVCLYSHVLDTDFRFGLFGLRSC